MDKLFFSSVFFFKISHTPHPYPIPHLPKYYPKLTNILTDSIPTLTIYPLHPTVSGGAQILNP